MYPTFKKPKENSYEWCGVAQCVEQHEPGLKKEGGERETQSHEEEETELRNRIIACMLSSIWDYMTLGDLLVAQCDESEMCETMPCAHVSSRRNHKGFQIAFSLHFEPRKESTIISLLFEDLD